MSIAHKSTCFDECNFDAMSKFYSWIALNQTTRRLPIWCFHEWGNLKLGKKNCVQIKYFIVSMPYYNHFPFRAWRVTTDLLKVHTSHIVNKSLVKYYVLNQVFLLLNNLNKDYFLINLFLSHIYNKTFLHLKTSYTEIPIKMIWVKL